MPLENAHDRAIRDEPHSVKGNFGNGQLLSRPALAFAPCPYTVTFSGNLHSQKAEDFPTRPILQSRLDMVDGRLFGKQCERERQHP